jgi:hypothetical protein
VVIIYRIIVLTFEYVCPFVAGTRHQELSCTRWQYLCDGFCTSVIHIIPVLALFLFLSSIKKEPFEDSQVCEFLKFYFCPLYKVIVGISHITVPLFIIIQVKHVAISKINIFSSYFVLCLFLLCYVHCLSCTVAVDSSVLLCVSSFYH